MLAIALALGTMRSVPWAIALLACEFMLSLYVRDVEASFAAAAYGSALLLVAELAYWSVHLRIPSRCEPGPLKHQAFVTAALGAASLGAGVVAAALSQAPVAGSLVLMAAGVGAVGVAIAIVVAVIWTQSAGSA
jgi:hypothetical protein